MMALFDWIQSIQELFENFQSGVMPDLGTWSYILLALLVATEGPLSTLIGASAAAAGLLEWQWVLIATILGNIAGDCLWYSVGYAGKMQWLYDHGRLFGMRPHHVERLEREMQSHARKLIIFAKIAYGLIVPTLVAAGLARVPWRKWFPVVFVVETLWSILLVWLGYHATVYIQDFTQTLHVVGAAALIGLGLFVGMRFLRRRIDQQELALDPLVSEPQKGAVAAVPEVEESFLVNRPADVVIEIASHDDGQSEKYHFTPLHPPLHPPLHQREFERTSTEI